MQRGNYTNSRENGQRISRRALQTAAGVSDADLHSLAVDSGRQANDALALAAAFGDVGDGVGWVAHPSRLSLGNAFADVGDTIASIE